MYPAHSVCRWHAAHGVWAAKNVALNQGKQVRTMGPFSFRSYGNGRTAKRFNTIAQGKRSAALGLRLGKNSEP